MEEEDGLGRGSGFQGRGTKRLTQLGATGDIFQLGLEKIHFVFNSFMTSSLAWLPKLQRPRGQYILVGSQGWGRNNLREEN